MRRHLAMVRGVNRRAGHTSGPRDVSTRLSSPSRQPVHFCIFASPPHLTRIASASSIFLQGSLKLKRSRISWLVSHLAHPAQATAPSGSRHSQALLSQLGSGSHRRFRRTMLYINCFRTFFIFPFTLDVHPPFLDHFSSSSPSR